MKIISVKSYNEFIHEFDKYYSSGDFYYRGQSVSKWEIKPGLGRNKYLKTISSINKTEVNLINSFQKIISDNNLNNLIPFMQNSYHEDWQWLMSAQHYGLPTRLIDFSHHKYTALQFAIADFENLNSEGALLIYTKPEEIQEEMNSKILKNKHIPIERTFFFQAPIYKKKNGNDLFLAEDRKGIQGSKFLYRESSCLSKCISQDDVLSKNLIKILIPKDIKIPLIKYLMERQEFAYDIYCGRNDIDNYAAILKNKFKNLNLQNLDDFLKN
jgi:FRG domain